MPQVSQRFTCDGCQQSRTKICFSEVTIVLMCFECDNAVSPRRQHGCAFLGVEAVMFYLKINERQMMSRLKTSGCAHIGLAA